MKKALGFGMTTSIVIPRKRSDRGTRLGEGLISEKQSIFNKIIFGYEEGKIFLCLYNIQL